MRSSIRQVAERAGVSRMTVSRVLQGRADLVTDITRKKVMQAARELRYVPVPQPVTQTRRGTTRIIGLVFGDIQIYDEWGMPIYRGLCEVAMQNGYDLLTLLSTGPEWMIDQQELRFLDRRSDGFIFIVPTHHYKAMETLLKHDIPVVTCSFNDLPSGVAAVGVEDEACMRMAVQYLVERGHRRIIHLSMRADNSIFLRRGEGYATAMAELGLAARVVMHGHNTAHTENDWQSELRDAIESQGITAIVAANDFIALAAWRFLEGIGLNVPGDVSITGMDDLHAASERGLTSVGYSSIDAGRLAMKTMIDLIAGDRYPPNRIVIPATMVERASVACRNSS